MSIPVECPSCGRVGKAPDHLAGQNVACPSCGDTVSVPDDGKDDFEAPPPRPRTGWSRAVLGPVLHCPHCGGLMRRGLMFERSGPVGALCVGVGLIVSLVFFPLGLIIGVPLMLAGAGSTRKRVWKCRECGSAHARA